MANNVLLFPGKRPTKSSDKREQDEVDEVKKFITDDLRRQLLEECRRKHGFSKKKRE